MSKEYAILQWQDAEIPVLSFHGEENLDYTAWFEVVMAYQDRLEANLPDILTLQWQDKNRHIRQFRGCLNAWEKITHPQIKQTLLVLRLTTPLGQLLTQSTFDLYLGVNDREIIYQQLALAGYDSTIIHGLPIDPILKKWRMQHPNENNYMFLQRLLKQNSLFAWESCVVGGHDIVLHQGQKLTPIIDNVYTALFSSSSQEHQSFCVTHVNRHQQQAIQQWHQYAYSNDNPSQPWQAQHGAGQRQRYQAHQQINSQNLAQRAAYNNATNQAMQANYITGKGYDARWYAGACITLEGDILNFRDWHPLNQQGQSNWRLVALIHRAIYDSRIQPPQGYSHDFAAIPSNQVVRPNWPDCLAMTDIIGGIVQGDRERVQADLDAQGQYLVKPQADLVRSSVSWQTVRLPRLQFYAGEHSDEALSSEIDSSATGLHSPLRDGDFVQIGFLHHDPDQPFIINSWPTADEVLLASQQQFQELGWHSESGQHVRWLDQADQSAVQANTHSPDQSDEGVSFQLKPEDTHLKAPYGYAEQYLAGDWYHCSGQNTHYSLKGDNNTTVDKVSKININQRWHQQVQGQSYRQANTINYHSQNHHTILAQQSLHYDCQHLHFDSDQDWIIESCGGELILEGSGTYSSDKAIHIHSGGAGIILNPGGDIKVYGQQIGSISPSVKPSHPKPPKNILAGPSPTGSSKIPLIKPINELLGESKHMDDYQHTLIIDLGDTDNLNQPDKPPLLAELFNNLYWTIQDDQGTHLQHRRDGYRLYVNVTDLVNTNPSSLYLTPQPTNKSIWYQYTSMIKLDTNTYRQVPQLPLLIAINQQKHALAAHESVPYEIPIDQWFNNGKQLQQQNTSASTLISDYYYVHLSFMPPAIMLNFRHDAWLKQMPAQDKQCYDKLKGQGYFSEQIQSTEIEPQDTVPNALISWFQEYGNNVTLFIHGYNVAYGQMGFIKSQPQFDQHKYPNPYAWSLYYPDMPDEQQPEGAFKWFLEMEYNLNRAAGFDGKDYSQYTRVVGIAWQGDPSSATNYMAATAMTDFPARKLAGVIRQLKKAGLYVNLMAHSLGNAVLMNTLNRLAQDNTAVDHVFLWEAAIPDNSWDEQTRDYFPMAMSSSHSSSSFPHSSSSFPRRRESSATGTKDESSANQSGALPYDYNYPRAHQAVQQVTVLYSGEDTILGASVNQQSSSAQPQTIGQMTQQLIHDGLTLALNHYLPSWLPHPKLDSAQLKRINQKIEDPGAGLMFALPNLVLGVIDQHGIQGYEHTLPALRSIYHLANWFVYPLSYFLVDTHHHCQAYYQRWQQFYQTWQPANGMEQKLPESLEEQKQVLKQNWPKTYERIHQLVQHLQQLVDEPDQAYPYFDHVFNQLHQAGREQLRFYLPDIEIKVIDWLLSSTMKEDFHQLLHKLGRKFLNGAQAQQLLKQHEDLVTIVLTVLMTPQAEPAEAMGHHGAQGSKAETMQNQQIFAQDGQKDNQGNSVCLDHSAMLVPSEKMKQFVYDQVLFAGKDRSFQKFGDYDT